MLDKTLRLVLALALMGAAGEASTQDTDPVTASGRPAEEILQTTQDTALRALAREALARHPGLHASSARQRAMRLDARQAKALPDPSAEVTAFALPPETRVGPQRLSLGFSQVLPARGERGLKESAVLHAAQAAEEELIAERVRILTDVRVLYHELLFLDRYRDIVEVFREHLIQHEEISQARYATGVGSAQAVVKLQSEITRVERDLLDLESSELELTARVNRLRDRPAATPVERSALPDDLTEAELDLDEMIARASVRRRELHAADARIERTRVLEQVARKSYKPSFVVGLHYTFVDTRDDLAGRLAPPDGNGDDILGVRGGVRIPLWRDKVDAAVEQAVELQLAASSDRRNVMLSIATDIEDLSRRLPLAWRRLRLVEDLLIVQAEESLQSAQAGYVAGTLNALDLLDAEHVLFEANTALARAKTDYQVGLARLEGAVGEPLGSME